MFNEKEWSMNIAQIRKEFREYLTELASINKLSKKDAETQYSDADYPRKHADELGIDYWNSFKDNTSFEYMLSVLQNKFEKEGKNFTTIVPYKRALNSFRNFIVEKYKGVENMLRDSSKKYYWVCQGLQKEDKSYILAPVDNIHHHKRVNELKIGDVVVNYFGQEIKAISKVVKEPEIVQISNEDWYKVVLDYKELQKPILRSRIKQIFSMNNVSPFKYGPFDKNYDCNQGYLFNFSKGLLDLILGNNLEVNTKQIHLDKIQPLNQILYGPPGTGKTYNTVVRAMSIIDGKNYIYDYENNNYKNDKDNSIVEYKDLLKNFLIEINKKSDDNTKRIEFVTFHQSYSYEEFVEGIKPNVENEDLTYEKVDGIFKSICTRTKDGKENNFNEVYENFVNDLAENPTLILKTKGGKDFGVKLNSRKNLTLLMGENLQPWGTLTKDNLKNLSDWKYYANPIQNYLKEKYNLSFTTNSESKPHVLIIDEINRGNISKIFGELITLIEEDKRENLTVTLPYSQDTFTVPKNLYIIGTMNTSDRSIASIDIALRRRFKFVEMMPNENLVPNKKVFDINLRDIFEKLNNRISVLLDRDHQIGHSYFMPLEDSTHIDEDFENIWFDSILPLLNEYFYNDWEKLCAILGKPQNDGKSFIKKIDNVSFANEYSCDDIENYDFASKYDKSFNFKFALENAFIDKIKKEQEGK